MNSKQIIELAESINQERKDVTPSPLLFKYHYTIINKKTGEVLAESDYFDYMKILQIELIKLHEGFIDTKDIVIIDKLIRKEKENEKEVK